MYKIDTEKFNQTLQLLIGYIIDAQEKDTQKKDAQKKNHCDNPTKIDFHSGWLSEQEGYKRYIWHEAQKILKCNEWVENDLPGCDITNRVLKCMDIKIETGEPQNLLDYRYKIHYKKILEEKPQEVEDLLRRIYCSPDEEQAFRQGCALFGKRYPLMAFLFFLKGEGGDSAGTIRYLPVSPRNMESRFARLGIQSDCLSECTWENYQEYLCIFDDVQKRMQEQLNLDVEKIDAHSLVWTTWILDDNAYSVSETARQDAARAPGNDWPEWPRVLKTDYGQQEAIALFGTDPRVYQTTVKEFCKNESGQVCGAVIAKLKSEVVDGRRQMVPTGEETTQECDLVLIAAGFTGCEAYVADAFGVELTPRGTVADVKYATSDPKVFACGDMRRGQSLVVWALREGRDTAAVVDQALMGYTNL